MRLSLSTTKASTTEEPREGKLHAGICTGGGRRVNRRSYRDYLVETKMKIYLLSIFFIVLSLSDGSVYAGGFEGTYVNTKAESFKDISQQQPFSIYLLHNAQQR